MLAPAALRAQRVEAYATFNVTHLSQVGTGFPQTAPPFTEQYTSLTPIGLGGGVSLGVYSVPLVSVSLDARGSFHDGIGGQDNGLFGLKVGLNKPVHKLKPYVQGSVGFLSAHTRNVSSLQSGFAKTDMTFTSHYNIYEVFAGVDYNLKGHLDLRVIEVGGGNSFHFVPNTSLFTINSGVVLHF